MIANLPFVRMGFDCLSAPKQHRALADAAFLELDTASGRDRAAVNPDLKCVVV